MPRARQADSRPDQWLIDQTTFFIGTREREELTQVLATRTAADARAKARLLALQPFGQYSPGFTSRLFTAALK